MSERRMILLVEDNPHDAALAQRAFAKNKLTTDVILARDGVEALDILFGDHPETIAPSDTTPDMILLDLNLPRVNGFEVLRRIRSEERTRFVPVVILTSSAEPQDIFSGYSDGANSFIRKPVDFDEFTEVVRQLGQYWLRWNRVPTFDA